MRTRTLMILAVAACVAAASLPGLTHAQSAERAQPNHTLVDKIVVTSDRHTPELEPDLNNGEIYLLNLNGSGEQRLTHNNDFDGGGVLSPDGKKIVFNSNRNIPGAPTNISDLYLMNGDGSEQTFLTGGGSPSWSPDGKRIAYQASASGAPDDSDIFVVNVDDLLEHGARPRNLTNDPNTFDEDPDWSPDGTSIVYTSRDVNEPPATIEVYLRPANGIGPVTRLTHNDTNDRSPEWSHDGTRITFSCFRQVPGKLPRHELCVAKTSNDAEPVQLTCNGLPHLGPDWSPDDRRIFFNGSTLGTAPDGMILNRNQIWWVAADVNVPCEQAHEELLVPFEPTSTIGAKVGVLRVKTDN